MTYFRQISRSLEIGCYTDCIAPKFDRHVGNTAVEMPIKFQSDWKSLIYNKSDSRGFETSRKLAVRRPPA